MLRAEGLIKEYGSLRALDGLDIHIPSGSCLALFGPNGAGKSTLLKLLAGLSEPSRGAIAFEDRGDDRAHRRRIGYLGHDIMLYRKLSAAENLRFFASLYSLDHPEERVQSALQAAKLEHRAETLVGTFSRGMRQRLAIARATLHNPDLLLLDEPYTGLDPVAVEHTTQLFRGLHEVGRTLVIVTHDLSQGLALADRVLVLRHGRSALERNEPVADRDGFREAYFDAVSGRES